MNGSSRIAEHRFEHAVLSRCDADVRGLIRECVQLVAREFKRTVQATAVERPGVSTNKYQRVALTLDFDEIASPAYASIERRRGRS